MNSVPLALFALFLLALPVTLELAKQFARLLHRERDASARFLIALAVHLSLAVVFLSAASHEMPLTRLWWALELVLVSGITAAFIFPRAARAWLL